MRPQYDYQLLREQQSQWSNAAYYNGAQNQALHYMTEPSNDSYRSHVLHRPARNGSAREAEDGNGKPSRRRIALACCRCRKRKIRCSGDMGDGKGCTSCKIASQECNFVRVGSCDINMLGGTSQHTLGVSNLQAFSSTPDLALGSRINSGAFISRDVTGGPQPQDQFNSSKTLSAQVWSAVEDEHDPSLDAYNIAHSPYAITGHGLVYSPVDISRHYTPALSDKASFSQAFYEAGSAITSLPSNFGHYPSCHNSNRLVQHYAQPDRVLPIPHAALRPQISMPARLNEIARSVTLPFHPGPTYSDHLRPYQVWTNNPNSSSASIASSINSGSTDAIDTVVSKAKISRTPVFEVISASTTSGVGCTGVETVVNTPEGLSSTQSHSTSPMIDQTGVSDPSPASSRAVVSHFLSQPNPQELICQESERDALGSTVPSDIQSDMRLCSGSPRHVAPPYTVPPETCGREINRGAISQFNYQQ